MAAQGSLASARDEFAKSVVREAMSCFIAGNVTAVLAATVGALSILALSKPMGAAIAHWMLVELTGEMSAEAIESANPITRRAQVSHGVAIALGLASIALFVAGTVIIGTNF